MNIKWKSNIYQYNIKKKMIVIGASATKEKEKDEAQTGGER